MSIRGYMRMGVMDCRRLNKKKRKKNENKCTYRFIFLFIFHFWEDILYTKYPIGS